MPTLIDGSSTPGVAPLPGALVSTATTAELFINTSDGKLYYEDVYGTVQLLADVSITALANGHAAFTSGAIDGVDIGISDAANAEFLTARVTNLVLPSINGLVKSNGNSGVSRAVAGLDYVSPVSIGAPQGIASLDASGKVPIGQLPASIVGGLQYLGTWDAATNTPPISSGFGVPSTYYKVAVAGSTLVDGIGGWQVGDEIIFNGLTWSRISGSASPVVSVNGLTGAVTLSRSTIGAAKAGVNDDITELTALTTPLSVAQGGTGRSGLHGIYKGTGSTVVAATPNVDYALPPDGLPGQLLANRGSGRFANVIIGNGLDLTGGVLTASIPTFAAVTSVDVSGGTTGLTFSGGPVVDNGVLVVGGVLEFEHGGTGATSRQQAINRLVGTPVNRSFLRGNGTNAIMSLIQPEDVPVLNQNTTGTASSVTAPNQPNITSLGNLTSLTVAGQTFIGSELIVSASPGADGQVLTSQGPGNAPIWKTPEAETTNAGTVRSVAINPGTTGLTFSGGPITDTGVFVVGGVLDINHGGTGTTQRTGSGANVLATAPNIKGAYLSDSQLENTRIGTVVPAQAVFTTVDAAATTTDTLTVNGEINFLAKTAVRVPAGTTLERPALASNGHIRYNTDLEIFEGSRAGAWVNLGVPPTASHYQKISTDYLAASNDLLAVDTSLNPVTVTLPLSPLNGARILIVDAYDLSVSPLTIEGNGRNINGSEDPLEVSTKGANLTIIYVGTSWQVYGSSDFAWQAPTGTGVPVLSESPVLVAPDLGTPVHLDLANASNLSIETGTVGTLPTNRGGTGVTSLPTTLLKGDANGIIAATAGVDYAAAIMIPYGSLLSGNNNGGVTAIEIGDGLELDAGVLKVSASSGFVTSVTMSGGSTGLTFLNGTVTSSGTPTLSGTLGVANGGTGATTLTGLVKGNGTGPMTAAEPGVDFAPATDGTSNELLANNGDGGFYNVTVGQGLFLSNGVLTTTTGHGSVISVDVSGGDTGLTFTGGPITGAGIITMEGVLSVENGGTGMSAIGTGLIKGNGTSFVPAVPDVDFAAPNLAAEGQILGGNGTGATVALSLGAGMRYDGTLAQVYVEFTDFSTDNLNEGSNLYFTEARVLATHLTGMSLAVSAPVEDTDTVLTAIGKLQAQMGDVAAALAEILGN